MKNVIKLMVGGMLLTASTAFAMQHALLVQNSGWMEPFYSDASSQLKALVGVVADTVAASSDSTMVLAFNQSSGTNQSPSLIYRGAPGGALRTALDKVALARKGSGPALADTDFNEAVFKTITGPFGGKPGILWIFTNNKNSPNNSNETAARNREFYRLIHDEPAITRTLAFPLSMPVKGKLYSANGLMVYALAYGAEAEQSLQSLIANGQLRKVFTQQPAQLKPLNREAVRLVPKAVRNASNTSASLGNDGRTVVLDVDVSHKQPVVQLVAAMENMFYPYDLGGATLSAQIEGKGWSNPLELAPPAVSALAPGAKADVTISIPMQTDFPDAWSLAGLMQFGRRVLIPARIQIRLDEQRLGVNSDFRERLAKIFPGDPLPDVFVPPQSARSSVADIPLLIRINYPLYPLIIAMGVLLLGVAGAVLAARRSRAPASYQVTVDGLSRRVSIPAFGSVPVFDPSGKQVAVLRRRGGMPVVEQAAPGHAVKVS